MSSCNYTPPRPQNENCYYSMKKNYKSHAEYLSDKLLQQRISYKTEIPYRNYKSNEDVILNKKDLVKYNYQFMNRGYSVGTSPTATFVNSPYIDKYCNSRDCKVETCNSNSC